MRLLVPGLCRPCGLCYCRCSNVLFATCMDGRLRAFNASGGALLASYGIAEAAAAGGYRGPVPEGFQFWDVCADSGRVYATAHAHGKSCCVFVWERGPAGGLSAGRALQLPPALRHATMMCLE